MDSMMNKSLARNALLTRGEGTRSLESEQPKREFRDGQRPHQEIPMNSTFDEISIAICAFTVSSASIALLVVVVMGAI
jgi:hypothetical protein